MMKWGVLGKYLEYLFYLNFIKGIKYKIHIRKIKKYRRLWDWVVQSLKSCAMKQHYFMVKVVSSPQALCSSGDNKFNFMALNNSI